MHTLEQLRSGELQNLTQLKISQQLTTFPREIFALADSLEILDLTDNRLCELPDDFAQLTKLRIVFMSNNCFTALPTVLGQCPNLEMIGFKSNQITTVDESSLPEKLRWLILTDNHIETLPDSLGLRPRLEKLALAGNRLTELPSTMDQLHRLALVRLSANRLQTFPTHLLDLPKLAWLAFSGNDFNRHQHVDETLPEISSNDYVLEKVLGQGASGVISLAQWRHNVHQLPEAIAVKVFKGAITSDGYPHDELNACLKTGQHPHLVQSLAHVTDPKKLALVMALIPPHFKNLGLPPTFETCTRDTFPSNFSLSISQITHMVRQMTDVVEHMQQRGVAHGDIYAHNTLFDDAANILVGDFGAASIYDDQPKAIQQKIKIIEYRALGYFIEDLLSVCHSDDISSPAYTALQQQASTYLNA